MRHESRHTQLGVHPEPDLSDHGQQKERKDPAHETESFLISGDGVSGELRRRGRLTGLPSLPHLGDLRLREPSSTPHTSRRDATTLTKVVPSRFEAAADVGAVNVEGPPPKQGSPRSPYCPSASTADYEQKPLPMGGSARAKARLNSRGLNRATGVASSHIDTCDSRYRW